MLSARLSNLCAVMSGSVGLEGQLNGSVRLHLALFEPQDGITDLATWSSCG